jgi:phage repressor protein C with HTH and peptisase S24 domain
VEIPQFRGVGGSMGNGLILRDLPGEIQGWRVTPEWLSKNVRSHTGIGNLCIVTGFGPSMKPMFNPGDPLLMDRGVKTVEFDGIYFFRVGEEGFIKMLQRVPGEGLRVVSKNKDYETWTIKADMDFEVFGLIIKVWCGTDS